jgi:hypothetical protein
MGNFTAGRGKDRVIYGDRVINCETVHISIRAVSSYRAICWHQQRTAVRLNPTYYDVLSVYGTSVHAIITPTVARQPSLDTSGDSEKPCINPRAWQGYFVH